MLWRVITVSITLGVLLASFRISPTLPGRVPCALVGVALFGIGTVLRWWSIQHRGRFFTVDVAIASDHRLVDTGPYRWVRHPSYTGLLLQFAGLALSLNNLLSAIAVIGPITLALNHSIRIEEEALRNTLGEA